MTGLMKTRRNRSDKRRADKQRRPSVLALLLLLVGAWASIATSPAESWVQETGEEVIAADAAGLQFSWEVTSDRSEESVQTGLWWELSSETGAEPELSVVFPDEMVGRMAGAPVSSFESMPAIGAVEFVVTNPEETGAVTVAWDLTARVEEEQAELGLTANTETITKPSPRVALPQHYSYYNDIAQVATIYTINATAPREGAGGGLLINLQPVQASQQPQPALAAVQVNDVWTQFRDITVVPWPTGCTSVCTMSIDMVINSSPAFSVDSNDPDGSVTVLASRPHRSEPTWVDVGPAPMLSEQQVYLLDIELPNDGPLGQQVAFSAVKKSPQNRESFCSVPVSYTVKNGGLSDPVGYLNDDLEVNTAAWLSEGGETVEVRLGPTTSPDCEIDRNEPVSVSIGVTTYGVTPPAQATVTVR